MSSFLHTVKWFQVLLFPSDGLMSYPGHMLGVGSYSFAEMQPVYLIAPADKAQLFIKEYYY